MGRVAGLVAVTLAVIGAVSIVQAQQTVADLVLVNGKIITVDDRFTLAQAVAISGDHIAAVGTSRDIGRFIGAGTQQIDLKGRTVIPGLIDNHLHLMRAGTTWQWEVRWDGITSRIRALNLLRDRAKEAPSGAWVFNLGGWALEQFADDKRPFSRDELDRIVPDHPVLLQASYYRVYLNSAAIRALGLDDNGSTQSWIERDASGRPTGVIGEAGVRQIAARLPVAPRDEVEASSLSMIHQLNAMGLTTAASVGCDADLLSSYQRWAEHGRLNMRVFCIVSPQGGGPRAVDDLLNEIPRMKLFGGNPYVDHVAYGEAVFGPLQDPMFVSGSNYPPEQLAQFRRIATAIANAGLPLQVHANLSNTIDAFLDQIEAINSDRPIRPLRWTLAHVNDIRAPQLERMKRLGMYAAVHPWSVINGGIYQTLLGSTRTSDLGPLATIQSSGIVWGLGSDGTRANQIRPFTTLSWAVTGRMVGGSQVLRDSQTISREDALIAHTRHNAFLLFRENDLGSIQRGRLADLLVLDRDYLTVPADQIKDIEPLLTVVGGRIVYDATAQRREP